MLPISMAVTRTHSRLWKAGDSKWAFHWASVRPPVAGNKGRRGGRSGFESGKACEASRMRTWNKTIAFKCALKHEHVHPTAPCEWMPQQVDGEGQGHRRHQRTLGVGVNGGVQPRGHHVPEVHALGVDHGLWGRHVLHLRDEQALPTIVANRLRHEGGKGGGGSGT